AYGITAGASVWALFAGLGMGAILTANQWLFETLRLLGAGYLAWLGIRAARAAIRPDRAVATRDLGGASLWVAALRGALIHLTNPKALLFWGSIFAIGIAPGAPASAVIWVIALSMGVNVAIVTAWALLFSRPAMMAAYLRFRRWIEATFAAFFGAAATWIVANRTA
ncbi:MAG: LysE family transporter, partial [Pseudomonadota bacterium]